MKLRKITLASRNTEAVVKFYSTVMDVAFEELKAYGASIFSCLLDGLEFQICPEQIAGVTAQQNRHQLEFKVDDLEGLMSKIELIEGAEVVEKTKSGNKLIATVEDPDGNTIVFIEELF